MKSLWMGYCLMVLGVACARMPVPIGNPIATASATARVSSASASETAFYATIAAASTAQIATVLAQPLERAAPTLTRDPTASRTPTSTPRSTPTPGVLYKYDARVTPDQKKLIQDSLALGKKYLGDIWTLEVYAYADNNFLCDDYKARTGSPNCAIVNSDFIAFATGYLIFVKTYSEGWQRASTAIRIHAILHEYYHSVQFYLASQRAPVYVPRNTGAFWLIEGSAEFAGVNVLYNEGLFDVGIIRQAKIFQVRDIRAPLKNLETRDGARAAGAESEYTLGFLATEYLALNYGGIQKISEYYETIGSGKTWQDAFEKTYGFSVDTFYDRFEDYRKKNFPPR